MSHPSQHSARPWRDVARELAREPDHSRRRALMKELSESSDPRFAPCAICNRLCELTTCKIDEEGHPVHERCYVISLNKAAGNGYS